MADQPNVYFQRDVLCYSLEGRAVEIVTITSMDGMSEQGDLEEDPDDKD